MSITLDRFIHVLYNQSLSGIVNYSSVSYARVSRRSSVFCRRPTVGLILLTTLRARYPCNRILCAYTCDYSYLRKITNETNFFLSDKSVAYLPASLFSKHHLSFCCIFFLPFPLTHPHPKQIHTYTHTTVLLFPPSVTIRSTHIYIAMYRSAVICLH
jgi:hypothetical protein